MQNGSRSPGDRAQVRDTHSQGQFPCSMSSSPFPWPVPLFHGQFPHSVASPPFLWPVPPPSMAGSPPLSVACSTFCGGPPPRPCIPWPVPPFHGRFHGRFLCSFCGQLPHSMAGFPIPWLVPPFRGLFPRSVAGFPFPWLVPPFHDLFPHSMTGSPIPWPVPPFHGQFPCSFHGQFPCCMT